MISTLFRLSALRGTGVVVYATALVFFMPSENIARDLSLLLLIEFFHGMLYPTTRTKILSGQVPAAEYLALMAICAILTAIIILLFVENKFASLCVFIYLTTFPVFVGYASQLERLDIEMAIRTEAYTAFCGAILASIVIYLTSYMDADEQFVTPVVRIALLPIIFLLAIIIFKFKLMKLEVKIPKKESFNKVLIGMEYLSLLNYLRFGVLKLVSMQHESTFVVKLIAIIYEPISSIYGYILRYVYSKAGFVTDAYIKATRPIILITFLLAIVAVLYSFVYGANEYVTAIMCVALFLGGAGLTTQYIIGNTVFKTKLLIVLGIGLMLTFFIRDINVVLIFLSVGFITSLVGVKVLKK